MVADRNVAFPQAGVSILELSVVIVIIGLLVATVTGGFFIRKASEIRAIVTDMHQFQSAFESFDLQYEDLPGDISDATRYWSASANGDGDDIIEYPVSGNIESLRAWQQLSLAGLIEGSYTGVASDGNDQADIGISVPESKRALVGYYPITGHLVGGNTRHEIRVGAYKAGAPNDNASLTPQEARSIDNKLDDGNPTEGSVLAVQGDDMPSELCQSADGSDYLISTETKSCIIAFPAFP